jgi:hypothetical protein
MKDNKKLIFDIVILLVSFLVLAFWILANQINVYENKFVGIIYEILWLPFLLLVFVLPVLTTVLIISRKLIASKILFLALAIQVLLVLIQLLK